MTDGATRRLTAGTIARRLLPSNWSSFTSTYVADICCKLTKDITPHHGNGLPGPAFPNVPRSFAPAASIASSNHEAGISVPLLKVSRLGSYAPCLAA